MHVKVFLIKYSPSVQIGRSSHIKLKILRNTTTKVVVLLSEGLTCLIWEMHHALNDLISKFIGAIQILFHQSSRKIQHNLIKRESSAEG